MKKTSLLISSAVAGLLLSGCGSSSASTSTGTGSYVDSAVKGVTYKCGSQTGTTDEKGTFIFEEGKGCTFEVAGITLRKESADDLHDNVKIVENNETVARFLQSIDADGNPNDGIDITPKEVEALKTLCKEKHINHVPEKDDDLNNIIQGLHKYGFDKCQPKTMKEVNKHLNETKTVVTKELLAGKTFYAIGKERDENEIEGGKIIFDKDLTKFTYTEEYGDDKGEVETDKIKEIDGNEIIWQSEDGYTMKSKIKDTKRDYIEVVNYYDDDSVDSYMRLYFDKAKADDFANMLKKNTKSSKNED